MQERKKMNKLPDKWFYFPIAVFTIILVIKFIQLSEIINYFPFNIDLGGYMTSIYFLAKFGYHQVVQNWYEGNFILFQAYPSSWFFFSLPIYYLVGKNTQLAAFISIAATYLLGFIFIFLLGKFHKFSVIKRIAFFLLFFISPIAISQIFTRAPELFGWVIFIPLFILILHYKDNKLDKKFYLFKIIYALMLITYPDIFMLSTFLVLSLFLIKKAKEKLLIILSSVIALLLSLVWLYQFLLYLLNSFSVLEETSRGLKELITFNSTTIVSNIYTTLIVLVFLTIFYFYWKDNYYARKELVFYSPILVLAFLYITRLLTLVPLFNKIFPDTYNLFFIFLTLFLLFKINFLKFPKLKKIILIALILIPIISLFFTFVYQERQSFKYTEIQQEIVETLAKVDGKLFIATDNSKVPRDIPYDYSQISYSAITHDIYTPQGQMPISIPKSLQDKLDSLTSAVAEADCEKISALSTEFKVTNIITFDNYCDNLKKCSLKESFKKSRTCLYKL